ncbi:LOW QUALITY PROTEIN: hypothetical protein M513_04323 [Trichuris suis]|uniref:acid phosphatase n=1 Tax=Trichuris suis TaxID=68888 RepID=A0A085MCE3_9BILA|nr:LOW QUALITY PROTEIN: hypothetical protein M513_04323 [Trichuris suis]
MARGTLLCLLLGTLASTTCGSTLKLVFVHTLYRHGERSPLGTYPNDPYKEDIQLLPLGCQQQYELGHFLRARYANFLSPRYNASEIYVRSTDSDRTLASAYCNLAGLYPPTGDQIWNPLIHWQPIPVHTVPIKEDFLVNPEIVKMLLLPFQLLKTKLECRGKTLTAEKEDSQIVAKIRNAYSNFFRFLSTTTGISNFKLENVPKVQGALEREEAMGYMLPLWVFSMWYDPRLGVNRTAYDILRDLRHVRTLLKFNSPSKSRLDSGLLIGSMASAMRDKVKGRNSNGPKKMVMYSAHEGTLLSFLYALNISNNLLPPMASCILVELFKSAPGKHFVAISYRNETHSPPYPLTLPTCEQAMCPFETFISIAKKVAFKNVNERQKACNVVKLRDSA